MTFTAKYFERFKIYVKMRMTLKGDYIAENVLNLLVVSLGRNVVLVLLA